jgi:hypothetical protein
MLMGQAFQPDRDVDASARIVVRTVLMPNKSTVARHPTKGSTMDASRFDTLTRLLATRSSRRAVLAAVFGGVAAVGRLTQVRQANATRGVNGPLVPPPSLRIPNMAVIQESGRVTPSDEVQVGEEELKYVLFGDGTPALRGFRLAFDPPPQEHETTIVQVLAGGASEDLTPNEGNPPVHEKPDGSLWVAMQDLENEYDTVAYQVSHSVLPDLQGRRYQVREAACQNGECVFPLPSSVFGGGGPTTRYVVALVGFKLQFPGVNDYGLERIGVWFADDGLHVAMRGGDATTPVAGIFSYLVDFVVIPYTNADASVSSEVRQGTGIGTESFELEDPNGSHFLLTGWELGFKDGPHPISAIGVRRTDTQVRVDYLAHTEQYEFDWRVQWAQVGPPTGLDL